MSFELILKPNIFKLPTNYKKQTLKHPYATQYHYFIYDTSENLSLTELNRP